MKYNFFLKKKLQKKKSPTGGSNPQPCDDFDPTYVGSKSHTLYRLS